MARRDAPAIAVCANLNGTGGGDLATTGANVGDCVSSNAGVLRTCIARLRSAQTGWLAEAGVLRHRAAEGRPTGGS